jgi:hypothetical protein
VGDRKFSLVNLGDFAKPANTLIERCSDAVGGLFAPHQIRRIARAQADADKTDAKAQIEISNLQRRAVRRWIAEEGRKQQNMEAILQKALPDVKNDAKPEAVNEDWLTNFFDKGRLISDEQMQLLWGRILAGEANAPGQFSKKTVNLVASLDKEDAITFSSLCRFVMNIEGYPTLTILDPQHPIYSKANLPFGAFMHLDYTGLIQLDVTAHISRVGLSKEANADYFGEPLSLTFEQDFEEYRLNVGCAVLTQAGRELHALSNAEPCDGFIEVAAEYWKKYSVSLRRLNNKN